MAHSDDFVLEDFYCKNDNTSWTEDSVSIYRSSNASVRRGLIDGNNSPTGGVDNADTLLLPGSSSSCCCCCWLLLLFLLLLLLLHLLPAY